MYTCPFLHFELQLFRAWWPFPHSLLGPPPYQDSLAILAWPHLQSIIEVLGCRRNGWHLYLLCQLVPSSFSGSLLLSALLPSNWALEYEGSLLFQWCIGTATVLPDGWLFSVFFGHCIATWDWFAVWGYLCLLRRLKTSLIQSSISEL